MSKMINKTMKWLKAEWILRQEVLRGEPGWIIYYKQFGLLLFLERWNTLESVQRRLKELKELN